MCIRDSYKHKRLDDETDKLVGAKSLTAGDATAADKPKQTKKAKRRAFLREYLRWLRPYRYAIAFTFFLALLRAGLEMVEPLFMRFIVDHVLPVSYTHLRAHETPEHLVCRL